jgi:CRISPR-associated DxTHG motif protein
LPEWYGGLPFDIIIHTAEIGTDTAGSVFVQYNELPDKIKPDSDILFDITHGFRSMPMLVYQALQYGFERTLNSNVKIIYGEYIDEEKIAHVRDLSQYWEMSIITRAKNLFISRLDGKLLADKTEPYWESGAKVLRRFSDIVECNYSLRVPELVRQIKNSLKDELSIKVPEWVNEIRSILAEIYGALNDKSIVAILRKYSKLLEKKGLFTQAVIALQVALETAVVLRYGSEEHIGNYKWMQKQIGKMPDQFYYFDLANKDQKNINAGLMNSLKDLADLRNQIAHGGAKSSKTGSYPSAADLPKSLKKFNARADEFLAKLADA